ncbi:hypothetical protein [Actinomadura sp. HBU206391]|uniref:hypothetical protein n=1 Tax=Actinomadura sp. HBU206391 TaxID=2731692 RepID=UPI001C9CB715|nr:hypothetical protein [Actinomadura sp. HBU206391]
MLSATSLGLVAPVLKDSGQAEGGLGQSTVAAASVADFGAGLLSVMLFPAGALALLRDRARPPIGPPPPPRSATAGGPG